MYIWNRETFPNLSHLYTVCYKFKNQTVHYYWDVSIRIWMVAIFQRLSLLHAVISSVKINTVNKMERICIFECICLFKHINSDVRTEAYPILTMGSGRTNEAGAMGNGYVSINSMEVDRFETRSIYGRLFFACHINLQLNIN